MAVTSLWAVKNSLADVVNYAQNPKKTECPDLAQVLRYAGNDGKTEHRYFVTGVGCLAETAGEQMRNTKLRFGKAGGYVAYHGYQSFKPGELTPAQAHEIGIQFAKRLWGEDYSLERMQVRIRQNSYTVQLEQPRYQKITTLADKCGQREHCYNRLRRCTVPEEVDRLKVQRDALTAEIAALRLESKVLYGIFLSRHSLSEQNGWRDPGGRTFFYCTIAETCRLLGCKRSKAMAVLLELERQSLISRSKQGRGKPDRIYLHKLQDS